MSNFMQTCRSTDKAMKASEVDVQSEKDRSLCF